MHPNKTSEVYHPDSDHLKPKRGTVVGIEQIKGETSLPLFSHFREIKTVFLLILLMLLNLLDLMIRTIELIIILSH